MSSDFGHHHAPHVTVNTNEHGGLSSLTTHLSGGGILHQDIGSDHHASMTDGHDHSIWHSNGSSSLSNGGHQSNSLSNASHVKLSPFKF